MVHAGNEDTSPLKGDHSCRVGVLAHRSSEVETVGEYTHPT